MIRFGETSIINIELKSTSTVEKIKKQLLQNKYYLSFLGKDIYNFSYISSKQKLYHLDRTHNLVEIKVFEMIKRLKSQKIQSVSNVDTLFNPSNYLISPFNSTEEFIKGQYFLTNHQAKIKNESIIKINSNKTSFISICGNAGTGKTLLTYDIAKAYMDVNAKVLVVHCGILNSGHEELVSKHKWDIIPAKNMVNKSNLKQYQLIIIDEVQRIYPGQLDFIIDHIKKHDKSCIFSYDRSQCLRSWEINNNVEAILHKSVTCEKFELTKKIRTNKEIASFIRGLFDKSKVVDKLSRKNIELNYFENYNDAKSFLEILRTKNWKIINYTPSRKDYYPYDDYKIINEENTHGVIGQEFDNVVAVIDSHFYYKGNVLSTKNYSKTPYYHPTKMLFQIVTRTRRKLNIIIINNEELMRRCLRMLN